MNARGLLWPILLLVQQHLARAIPTVTQRGLTVQWPEFEAAGVSFWITAWLCLHKPNPHSFQPRWFAQRRNLAHRPTLLA